MIVKCEQCQTRFKIPDEKVTDKGVKVRCTKCGHTFRVTRESAASPSGTSLPAVSSPPGLAPADGGFDPFEKFGDRARAAQGPHPPARACTPRAIAASQGARRRPGPAARVPLERPGFGRGRRFLPGGHSGHPAATFRPRRGPPCPRCRPCRSTRCLRCRVCQDPVRCSFKPSPGRAGPAPECRAGPVAPAGPGACRRPRRSSPRCPGPAAPGWSRARPRPGRWRLRPCRFPAPRAPASRARAWGEGRSSALPPAPAAAPPPKDDLFNEFFASPGGGPAADGPAAQCARGDSPPAPAQARPAAPRQPLVRRSG